VLETAAVLGGGGDVPTLLAAWPGDRDAALAALDTAARFGLLAHDVLADGRIAFPHMLTRQAVLDLIAPSRRALLHARIGEVLESSGTESPWVIRQAGHHFARASALGYGGKAAAYLLLSAREAERSLAFEDAAAWYEQAAGLLDGRGPDRADGGSPAPDLPDREELRFASARCHLAAGDFARARSLYRQLCDSRDPAARLRAAVGFEDAGWRPGLPGADARALLTGALGDVPADPASPGYVRALASLSRAMAFTGDFDRAREVGEQALGYARRLGDEPLLTHALQAMMWHAAAPQALKSQRALADELTGLAVATGDWEALGTAAVFRSAIAYMRGDLAAFADAIADEDRAVRSGGQPFMAYMRGCVGFAQAFLRGDFAAAEHIAEDLLELGRSFGPDDTEGPYGLQMFMVRRETGGLEPVRRLVDAARPAGGAWEPGLLALYTELGLGGAARRLLWQLLERLEPAPARQSPWAQWTAVLVFLAEATIALGDREAARRLRPLLAPFTGLQLVAGTFVAVFGPADAYLAGLDSLLGDDDSASRLFEQAVAQSRATGAVVHRAMALAGWARHLASRGEVARAGQLREEARRLAEGTGHARVMRMLAEASGPGASPAGLTARELEVLQLLTGGSSNRDIAVKLRISENTAANHVRSILTKTGAANRTQVAMMAVAERWVAERPGERAGRLAPRAGGLPGPGGYPAGVPASEPSGSTRSPSSTMTSAGSPARTAARRIASANGASYRQYVLRLSAERKEYSQRTPSSSLIRLIRSATSADASRSSANLRSIMKIGMASPPFCTHLPYRCAGQAGRGQVTSPAAGRDRARNGRARSQAPRGPGPWRAGCRTRPRPG
jgi:DNA-binding CsgD family transcriptional regulator/tetratricopeptide (TPR) repeat protein